MHSVSVCKGQLHNTGLTDTCSPLAQGANMTLLYCYITQTVLSPGLSYLEAPERHKGMILFYILSKKKLQQQASVGRFTVIHCL